MSKIKVSKAIGDVLNEYKGAFDVTLIDLVKRHCTGELRQDETVLYELNPIELSLAIALGHEIELTTKEKWEKEFISIRKEMDNHFKNGTTSSLNPHGYAIDVIKDMNRDFNLGLNLKK